MNGIEANIDSRCVDYSKLVGKQRLLSIFTEFWESEEVTRIDKFAFALETTLKNHIKYNFCSEHPISFLRCQIFLSSFNQSVKSFQFEGTKLDLLTRRRFLLIPVKSSQDLFFRAQSCDKALYFDHLRIYLSVIFLLIRLTVHFGNFKVKFRYFFVKQ